MDFELTKREILASISIVAIMLLIGVIISGKISDYVNDRNETYNKAVKIDNNNMFEYAMRTDVGHAFVYGDLEAADTVSYPEIDGEYIFVKKVEERYERHTRTVTKTDSNEKKHTRTEVYYEWDAEDTEIKHANEIIFCGFIFDYFKIQLPSPNYIDTLEGDKSFSFKSGEYVKVIFKYYGVSTKFTGTVFTDLRNNTISDSTVLYNGMDIDETVKYLESDGLNIGFWILWILLIIAVVFGFYYLDNHWLE